MKHTFQGKIDGRSFLREVLRSAIVVTVLLLLILSHFIVETFCRLKRKVCLHRNWRDA